MKNFKIYIAAVLCMLFVLHTASAVFASSTTSTTNTINSKGNYIKTQDAYMPDRTITSFLLNGPQDIFIDINDYLYVADTGNKRILKIDTSKLEIVMEISFNEFSMPQGVFVTDDNQIYVADTVAECIFVFDKDGELINKITRPVSDSFASNDFRPMKVAVDKGKNIYMLGEGIYDGIIQLSPYGEFLGYFASNKVNLNIFERIQDLFFTDEQKANLLDRIPTTFSNVFVDLKGIVYSTSMGRGTFDHIKKHNTAGQNMFKEPVISAYNMIDIYTDHNEIMYSISKEGYILVYTREGEYIYDFGSNADYDIAGLYKSLVSIAVDSKGTIWTIDSEKNFIQSFVQTDFSSLTYVALDAYNKGKYKDSIAYWTEILKHNQMSVLAHNNIGKNYLIEQDYEKAMYHSEIAGNRTIYSDAFWELRNMWLQNNMFIIVFSIIALAILVNIVKVLNRKTKIFAPVTNFKAKISEVKLINDSLYSFNLLRHPIDSFYYLKREKKGSTAGAVILFAILFAAYLYSLVGKGFIYQEIAPEDIDLQTVVIGFFAFILLFIVCNYLVSSINDGNGDLKDIFKMTLYSVLPLTLSFIITTVLSYVLTFNEVFVLQFITLVGATWTGVNIFIGIKETHEYEVGETIKSILLTILFIAIIIIFLLILVIMGEQLYQFFEAVVKEAVRNAKN